MSLELKGVNQAVSPELHAQIQALADRNRRGRKPTGQDTVIMKESDDTVKTEAQKPLVIENAAAIQAKAFKNVMDKVRGR